MIKYERISFTFPKGTIKLIDNLFKPLNKKYIFQSRSHFLFCLFMSFKPMEENINSWNSIKDIKIENKPYKFEVLTIAVPIGGKKQFNNFFDKLHKRKIFKSKGELIQKLIIFLSTKKDDLKYWGDVASWYLKEL